MTAQIKPIDFYLIKTAAILSALIMTVYISWSLNAPDICKIIPLILIPAVICFFLIRPPFSDYLPVKIFIVSIALISLGSPTNAWDARSIWLFHAKRIFIENDLYAQMDGYCGWSHNDYPVFIPALSATLAKIPGYWNEIFPKFSSVVAFIPVILLLSAVIKRRLSQLLLCNLLLFVLYKHFINGYMDGILAVYYTAASLLVYILTRQARDSTFDTEHRLWLYFLAILVFSALTLIKNEGIVLFATLILAAFLTRIIFQKTEITAATIIIFLLSVIPAAAWKFICHRNGISNDLTQSALTTQLARRILSVNCHFRIFEAFVLNLRFILPLLLFIFVSRNSRRPDWTIFVSLSSLLYFCILFATYLSTPSELAWHLQTSATRTILPISLSLGFYVLLFFAPEEQLRR